MDKDVERRLGFVTPAKRAEAIRRVKVLEEYGAISSPSKADASAAAEKLGISTGSFYRLVRVWNATRDPARIEPAGGQKIRAGRMQHPGDALVKEVLATLPAGRPVARDMASIRSVAKERGVRLRSAPGLFALVRDLRAAEAANASDRPRAFIDHVALGLAVDHPAGPIMPVASVLGVDGTILCVLLDFLPPDSQRVVHLIERAIEAGMIRSSTEAEPVTMAVDTDAGTGWSALFAALSEAGVERTGDDWQMLAGGRTGLAAVTPRLLGFRSYTLLMRRPPEGRRMPRGRTERAALTLDQAQDAMDELVLRGCPTPVSISGSTRALQEALASLEL